MGSTLNNFVTGTKNGAKMVSSYSIMDIPNSTWGVGRYPLFVDCATVPDPDSEQLSDIAITSAESFLGILRIDPAVSLLSFSTYGSAKHRLAGEVVRATELANHKRPDLIADGELQLDSALIPSIGKIKTKPEESSVATVTMTVRKPCYYSKIFAMVGDIEIFRSGTKRKLRYV